MFETKGKKAKELLAYYQAKLDEEARQAKAEGRLVCWSASVAPPEMCVAMDIAMVTLMNSDLALLPRATKLSRKTVRIIRENLFWAFGYNVVCIPIAAGVLYPVGILLSPMWASAAMAFSSVSVILNSLRLR